MTRDVLDRISMFAGEGVEVNRLALNMGQVEQYQPPPNPAKMTDSRAAGYVDQHGYDSWELDALEPSVMAALIRDALNELVDNDAWDEVVEREDEGTQQLQTFADNYQELAEHMDETYGGE